MKDVLLVGAGSYVIGDSLSTGVILPSLIYLQKQDQIGIIKLLVRSKRGSKFWDSVQRFQKMFGYNADIEEIVIGSADELHRLTRPGMLAFISVPDMAHEMYIDRFLDLKIPVWVVKPFTGSGVQSLALTKKSYNIGVPIWVDYHKRFDISNQKIKASIRNKEYGNLLQYSVQYSQPQIIPLQDIKAWSEKVNVFQYIGCHYVDQVFFHFPDCQPIRVSATGIPGALARKGGPKYDIIHAIIDFQIEKDWRLRADFMIGWNDPNGANGKSHQRLDLQFENGRIIADQKARGFQIWNASKTLESNPYFFEFLPEMYGIFVKCEGYGFESIKQFVSCCQRSQFSDSEHPWSFNSYKTDVVLDLINQSVACDGKWIEAENIPWITY